MTAKLICQVIIVANLSIHFLLTLRDEVNSANKKERFRNVLIGMVMTVLLWYTHYFAGSFSEIVGEP